jgi:hypothetical protein
MTLVTWLGPVLELGILLGLIVRRRLGRAVVLPFLLVALIASATIVGLCPACNTWDFWLLKEFVHAALFLLLGLELAHRAFAAGPARRAARRWTGVVLVVSGVLLWTAPRGLLIVEILPRLMGSLAWLYLGLAIVMLRHNVRIDRLHDAILSGFAPYLMVYAATWSQASENTRLANIVNPLVFTAVLCTLLHAAWVDARPLDVPWLRRHLRPIRDERPPEPSSTHGVPHIAAFRRMTA